MKEGQRIFVIASSPPPNKSKYVATTPISAAKQVAIDLFDKGSKRSKKVTFSIKDIKLQKLYHYYALKSKDSIKAYVNKRPKAHRQSGGGIDDMVLIKLNKGVLDEIFLTIIYDKNTKFIYDATTFKRLRCIYNHLSKLYEFQDYDLDIPKDCCIPIDLVLTNDKIMHNEQELFYYVHAQLYKKGDKEFNDVDRITFKHEPLPDDIKVRLSRHLQRQRVNTLLLLKNYRL